MNLLPMKNPTTVDMGENIAYIEKELAKARENQTGNGEEKQYENQPAT